MTGSGLGKVNVSEECFLVGFAMGAYGSQRRKYTGRPYYEHPLEVMYLVSHFNQDEEVLLAAVAHDLIEDRDFDYVLLKEMFGERVADIVHELTDLPNENLNRAQRKAIDRKRLALASHEAQTIKYADLISNTASIVEHDPKFAELYLAEKEALLAVMTGGDQRLRKAALLGLEKAKKDLQRKVSQQ